MTKTGLLGKTLPAAAGVFLAAAIGLCQAPPSPAGPPGAPVPGYGTAHVSYYQVGGAAFVPMSSTNVFGTSNNGYSGQVLRTVNGSFVYFSAPVSLPSGAIVKSIELDACDNTGSTGYVQGSFVTSDALGNATFTPFIYSDGTGCKAISQDVSGLNIVTNNATGHQWLIANVGSAIGYTTGLAGMKIGYQLQVSPGPATATFTDVPTTSGQFKFVEALVSAGITGGCGTGIFCPTQPVTRGQMAVFLAVALGLQFQ